MKSEQIVSQNRIIAIRENQLDAVQNTVLSEMRIWSEVLKEKCEKAPSVKFVKKSDQINGRRK
jgi:hypothetical protein